jgi:hypothetical protein
VGLRAGLEVLEKKIKYPTGSRTQDRPARSLDVILNELLRSPSSCDIKKRMYSYYTVHLQVRYDSQTAYLPFTPFNAGYRNGEAVFSVRKKNLVFE